MFFKNGPGSAGAPCSECPPTRSLPAGFTLIELITILIVLGAILAVVFPRFSNISDTYLRSDSSRLSSLIRYLNEAAETKKLYYRIDFDLDNGALTAWSSPDGREYTRLSEPAQRGFALSRGVEIEDIVVPGLGTVEDGEVLIVFPPTGSASPFTVHLRAGGGEKGEAMTLFFNPYSARVKTESGYH